LQHEDVIGRSNLRPRDRIVLTAREMFHQYGIRGVGVEAITEAAGTNKMTLYRHFGSKDDLIAACLQQVVEESFAFWDALEAEHPGDARRQLHALLDQCAESIETDGRGCELANAAVELTDDNHPARRVIEDGKRAHRERFAKLCERAGLSQPELAANMLTLLHDGARANRQAEGAEGPSAQFRRMAEAIVVSFSK
jgi:AcrR family transcriptional regulator